jgi:hypothetical protein
VSCICGDGAGLIGWQELREVLFSPNSFSLRPQPSSLDHHMPSTQQNHATGWRRLLYGLAEALVAIYVIVNAIALPLFRPLLRWLGRLRLALRLEALFADLSPYVVLALLLIPFLSAEPAKVYAVYLMGTGHLMTGAIVFVAAYFVSLVLVQQLYQAGKTKLRTLVWFARLSDWLFALRDRLIDLMKSTRAWIVVTRFERQISEILSRWILRWRNWFASLRT